VFVPQPSAGRSTSVNIQPDPRPPGEADRVGTVGNLEGGGGGTAATVFVRPAACERLEARQLLSVSMGADGFTDIGKSGDTRTVYVSSSSGSDSNNGLSSDRPVRTIAKGVSLLRDNAPDHLLLNRGDSWSERVSGWGKGGRSASEPMVFGAYGSGARPLIKSGGGTGFETAGDVDHLAIMGLHFWADKREPGASGFTTANPYGMRFVASTDGLLIEDCVIDQYADNILLSGYYGEQRNVKIRRTIVTDAWSTRGKAQGLYATDVSGLTLEENVFDHNGWNERVSGAHATALSHNAYIASDSDDVVVTGNVFADAGSHGLQARAGGQVEDNLFLDNPIGMSFGLVNGSQITPGGVSGTVNGNVFLGTRDISGSSRGWAVELGNIKGATVRNNIVSDDGGGGGAAAFSLGFGGNVSNSSKGVGINNLVIEDNVVHKWTQGVTLAGNLRPGGSGYTSLNNLTVRDNDFQRVNWRYHHIVSHWMPVNRSEENWSNNRYYEDTTTAEWFGIGGSKTSLDAWRNRLEPSAQNAQVGYSSPDRDVASYQRSIGETASVDGFLSAARRLAQGNWSSRFTARSVINHIRAGFGRSGTSNSGGTTTNPPPVSQGSGAPQVVSSSGTATSIKIKFSEDVRASLTAKDLQLKNVSTGNSLSDTLRLSYNTTTNEATWTWPGFNGGRLRAATWRATLPGAAVQDSAGNRLAGGAGFSFTFNVGTSAANNPAPSDSTQPRVVSRSGTRTAIKIRFSENVKASLTAKDLQLKNVGTGNSLRDTLRLSYNTTTNEATWTWPGFNGGRLRTGKWQVTLPDEAVTDAAGNRLAGGTNLVFTFTV
jgi:hypothetical protein